MKLLDVLRACGNYNNMIQIHDRVTDKTTGIMKMGNVPFKYIDKFRDRDVLAIYPATRGQTKFLYVRLTEERHVK